MKFKTRFFGVLAALALFATFGAGVATAEPIDVTLSAGVGTCSAAITSGASFNMGNYAFNPVTSQYEAAPGAGSAAIAANIQSTGAPGDRDCTVSLSSTDVVSGANIAFTKSQITLSVPALALSTNLGAPINFLATVPSPGPISGAGTLSLPSFTAAAVPPGNYQAVLTLTAVYAP